MVVGPHPIEITCNDADGNVKSGVKVFIRNINKKSNTSKTATTTNASGLAMEDAANLPLIPGQTLEYEAGDKLLIIAYTNDGQSVASLYTIAGDSHTLTLQLNSTRYAVDLTSVNIQSILGANTTGTVAFLKVYAVDDGELLAHLEVPGDDSRSHLFSGERGRSASGGYVIEYETAGSLIVTTTVR